MSGSWRSCVPSSRRHSSGACWPARGSEPSSRASAVAASEKERQLALQRLAEIVGGEARRRERERLAKLLTYCGASSVTVERRDRALEEETVDAVLRRIGDVEVAARRLTIGWKSIDFCLNTIKILLHSRICRLLERW
jgi:hypothetical protein